MQTLCTTQREVPVYLYNLGPDIPFFPCEILTQTPFPNIVDHLVVFVEHLAKRQNISRR